MPQIQSLTSPRTTFATPPEDAADGLPDWPLFGWTDDIRPALAAARASQAPAVLVTLHTLLGGGPRPAGTQMLFTDRDAAGFLSGGCIEADVALHARRTRDDGAPRQLVYGQGGPWPDIRLLCGARIELVLEKITPSDTAAGRLLALFEARQPALWRSDGLRRWVSAALAPAPACEVRIDPFDYQLYYEPVPRLVVIGGDPTALAIAQLAVQTGMETHLVRPKGPAQGPPLPGMIYSRAEPADALARIGLDPWSAVAVATHDEGLAEDALRAALPSPAHYVGVLGARRRLPERLARLRAAGLTEDQLARLRAPIGLELGGKAPWDVAVAVIAQLVQARGARARQAEVDKGCAARRALTF